MRISGLPDRADWRTVKDFLRDIADPAFVDNISNGEGDTIFICIVNNIIQILFYMYS